MAVQQVRSAPVASKPHAGPSAADLKTASQLKGNINEVLKRVRFGQPLSAAQSPKAGAKNEWKAPNGDRLIEVSLSKPPAGMADGMTTVGLVNPKTNEFFHGTFGGIAGLRQFHGPMMLPGTDFKAKTFNAKDIEALTAAANGSAKPAIPSKTTILNALGTYEFHKLMKYSAKAPAASDVLKKVPLKQDNHPDGYVYTGLVLKSGKVVIERSGGIAGIRSYSQQIDVNRLPK